MNKVIYLLVFCLCFVGCEEDEEETTTESLVVKEQLEISGVDIDIENIADYTLITNNQKATLDQELEVNTVTTYAQLRDPNGKTVAITYFNFDTEDIIISPKETALALAIDEFEFFLDLNVFNITEANSLKEAFYNFDGVVQLENKIIEILNQSGNIEEGDLSSELNYLRQKLSELELFTDTVSEDTTAGRPTNKSLLTPEDFTFSPNNFRITNVELNSVSPAENNSYDLSLNIGNASRLVVGVVRGQENNGVFIPNGTDYQYLFTADYEFELENILNILTGNGIDLQVRENNPINININDAYNQLVIVPPATDDTGKVYGANVLSYLLKGIIAGVEFYSVAPESTSASTASEYFDNVKADALDNITERIITEAPQLFQSAQNISDASPGEVIALFNQLITSNIVLEEIFNAIEDNYATFGGSGTLPLTLGQLQTKIEDQYPPFKKAQIAGTFVANFLASLAENIFSNQTWGIAVEITSGAGIFPEQAHNFQTYYYFDNAFMGEYHLKYSWDAVDPETGTVLNDIYYSDVNVTSLFLLESDVTPNEYLFENLNPADNYYYRIDTKDGINVTTGEPSVLPTFSQNTAITGTVNDTPTTDIVTETTDYVFSWNEIDNSTNETYNFTLLDSDDNLLEAQNNLGSNTLTRTNLHTVYGNNLRWKIETMSDNYEVKSEIFTLLISSPFPSLNTTPVDNITQTTATSGGNIVNDGGSLVTVRGVCWSTSPEPTLSDNFTEDGDNVGEFSSSITGLTENTTYYVRAYATNSEGTAYGNEEQFTTIASGNFPIVTTTSITEITQTTATSGGNVTDDGGNNIIARGVCWSTNPNPTTADNFTEDGTDLGEFTSALISLTENTTYYVRAYATNSEGTAYGNEEQFTTLASGNIPTVTTTPITNITQTTATSGGNVTDDGGSSVTAKGVCWSTNPNPTTANNTTNDGTGTGSFTSSLTSLTENTTYYVRAYATNSEGTAYGNEQTFITQNSSSTGGTVTDIDGNTYPTVIIGTQEWMAESLRVTHYPNGDAIPHITDNATWANLGNNNTDDAYSFYNNDNTTDYGALYTYAAAIADNWTKDNSTTNGEGGQGICPDGWHLPTDAEWTTHTNYLGGTSVAGGKMKETGTTHWNSPNTGATNSSGFTALPGGYRGSNSGTFNDVGNYGRWWSSTEYSSSHVYFRNLNYTNANTNRSGNSKSLGFCVRCIRD